MQEEIVSILSMGLSSGYERDNYFSASTVGKKLYDKTISDIMNELRRIKPLTKETNSLK